MPISYSVDVARGRLHMTIEGEFTSAEISSTIREIVRHPDLPDDFTALSDHTRVTRPINQAQLVGLVSIMEEFPGRFAKVRWAIVSTRPASYGMMRVLAARADLALGMQVRIFFDVQRATKWLDRGAERQRTA
jgi:hypothetical protein